MSKSVTITLQVKELVFDVQNKTYLTGRTHESVDNAAYESSSHMKASDEEEDIYQIKRSISNAFAVLKNHLCEYLVSNTSTSDNQLDATVDGDGALVVSLAMPNNHTTAAVDALGSNMHAYLVDMALAEWFAITSKADSEVYIAQSAIALDNIKRALYKRSRPDRPTYTS